jgi:high-affinity iron transporter
MVAALVIFLREGVEASMIVAILLAYLSRIGRRDLFGTVFAGVAVALGLVAVASVAIYATVRTYDGTRGQTIFETATYILASGVLTYMTFWMRDHARTITGELRQAVDEAIDGRTRMGMAVLAGQAVGREGLETAVFTLAIAFSTSRLRLFGGAAVGVVGALTVAVVIYRLGHRINLGRFFNVVGGLLMLFAAGLLVDAVENLQELGWLPFLGHHLWDTSRVLSEDTTLGDILHSFFGYADSPTVLMVLTYAVYAGIVLTLFFRPGRVGGRAATASGPVTPAVPAPPETATTVPTHGDLRQRNQGLPGR